MTRVIDLWRAVDPEAQLVSGSPERLAAPARGVARTRASAPHLPDALDGELLVADAGPLAVDGPLDSLFDALREAGLRPSAILLAGVASRGRIERAGEELPVLASSSPIGPLVAAAIRYLEDEPGRLTALHTELRLLGAEAALADPQPGAPAGVVATRLRRGVAVAVDGRLLALNARPSGTALAARFSATFGRLLALGGERRGGTRRTRDGLWLLETPADFGTLWLFDDIPFGRVDEVAADALVITLRALLRRPPAPVAPPRRQRPSSGDPMRDTLVAVALENGRVSPAARRLGLHRNTVLYRLRRARDELGIDPRRAEDALRLLRDRDEP